jgi:hypothetical protein
MDTPKNAKRLILMALLLTGLAAISLVWLRSTPVHADSTASNRLKDTRAALEQARSNEKILKSKDASRTAEMALIEFNAAREARIAEINARLGELNSSLNLNTTSAFDTRPGIKPPGSKPQDPKLLSEYQNLQTELAALNPRPLAPGNIGNQTETEPNDTSATANALTITAPDITVVTGSITAADIDFYSFTAPAGSRVWAYVDTGGGQSSPVNDRDSFLTLFDSAVAVLEEDDDDGTGNGSDSATESTFSSTIAGAPLTAGGTYYLAVEGFGPTSVIQPYRLFIIVSTSTGSAEVEPNGTAATASAGLTATGTVAVKQGSITPAGDVDFYSVVASAGDVIYISGDGNPERDATNTDLVIQLVSPGGVDLMTPAADSGLGGSATNPEGESFSFSVPVSGTYGVRVSGFGTSTGTYQLALGRASSASICGVTEFTGILGQNSTTNPGISGTQNGRLNRFVDQTGACNNVRTCPGLFTTVGARPYDAYSFTNSSPNPACVTVNIDAQACLATNFLVVAAYLGAYDPTNQCANYLADIGGSPNPVGVFSFNVPGNATFTLVLTAANASPTVCTTPYKVTVLGLPTFGFSIQDDVTGTTLQFDQTTGNYRFTDCASGLSLTGRGGDVQFGCTLNFGAGGGFKGGPAAVTANVNTCAGTGTATIRTNMGQTFNISDSNINDNSCFCP